MRSGTVRILQVPQVELPPLEGRRSRSSQPVWSPSIAKPCSKPCPRATDPCSCRVSSAFSCAAFWISPGPAAARVASPAALVTPSLASTTRCCRCLVCCGTLS
eukprot:6647970-Prymnesium_polylepis.1